AAAASLTVMVAASTISGAPTDSADMRMMGKFATTTVIGAAAATTISTMPLTPRVRVSSRSTAGPPLRRPRRSRQTEGAPPVGGTPASKIYASRPTGRALVRSAFPTGHQPAELPSPRRSGVVPGAPAASSAPHHQRDAGRDDDRPEDAPQRIPLAEQPPAQQRPDHDRGLPDRGHQRDGRGGQGVQDEDVGERGEHGHDADLPL